MNLKKVKIVYLVFFLITIVFIACDKEEQLSPIETFKQNIIGNWQSQASEYDTTAQIYGYRTLEITTSTWQIVIERFADEERTIPLFKLGFEGPYEITGESSVLTGSYNGTFSYTKKSLTSYVEPAMLGLGDCGLTINEPFDFSEIDCSWLESIEHCASDFDLISYEDGVLTPGSRTDNMCKEEGRPVEKGFAMNRI